MQNEGYSHLMGRTFRIDFSGDIIWKLSLMNAFVALREAMIFHIFDKFLVAFRDNIILFLKKYAFNIF